MAPELSMKKITPAEYSKHLNDQLLIFRRIYSYQLYHLAQRLRVKRPIALTPDKALELLNQKVRDTTYLQTVAQCIAAMRSPDETRGLLIKLKNYLNNPEQNPALTDVDWGIMSRCTQIVWGTIRPKDAKGNTNPLYSHADYGNALLKLRNGILGSQGSDIKDKTFYVVEAKVVEPKASLKPITVIRDVEYTDYRDAVDEQLKVLKELRLTLGKVADRIKVQRSATEAHKRFATVRDAINGLRDQLVKIGSGQPDLQTLSDEDATIILMSQNVLAQFMLSEPLHQRYSKNFEEFFKRTQGLVFRIVSRASLSRFIESQAQLMGNSLIREKKKLIVFFTTFQDAVFKSKKKTNEELAPFTQEKLKQLREAIRVVLPDNKLFDKMIKAARQAKWNEFQQTLDAAEGPFTIINEFIAQVRPMAEKTLWGGLYLKYMAQLAAQGIVKTEEGLDVGLIRLPARQNA
ncbi:hypothetical protein GF342_05670 [Candidatus Woesearchaeota archaeon]|nr:hypothetical protein [Candidatus Woesearchaeota archaeon]